VSDEALLLRGARAALARGDGATALARVDEHAARFPAGALVEERQAARVFALCASGRATEARATASTFLATSPRSPLAPQVQRTCATK
jgi:outer membrane protein assembly factor BamD (BamD/ComL family)